jgi:HAD superfamily hydrolase (TIGR01549 family)
MPGAAVLFDLDDTLFDHSFSARAGLGALRDEFPALGRRAFEELERLHAGILETMHARVLTGELTIQAARVARFAAMFQDCGAADGHAEAAADLYRAAYQRARRVVPGAVDLLAALRGYVVVGIVTNNVVAEQLEKLSVLELRHLVDVLVISEEAGMAKPDPRIFHLALARAGCRADQAVMVGDSWRVDILGALAAGIRPVWLNRGGLPSPDPRVAEIRALAPAAPVLRLLGSSSTS